MTSYIDKLREAKSAPVVTKVEFASFASGVPNDHSILVFEGVDDKSAYAHWLRTLAPALKFESHVKKGKKAVLQLFDALASDKTGLGGRTYYFVDRDFDDLQGRAQAPSIYMTDKYSIENYFVTESVLSDVLKDDFHCNGYNDCRQRILDTFAHIYATFLSETKELNFRIYAARQLNLAQEDRLPDRLNQIAVIELQSARKSNEPLEAIIPLDREPTEEELGHFTQQFDALEPTSRYRGKFALLFFIRWLTLARTDRLNAKSELFRDYPKAEFNLRGDFCFNSLLPRVPPPETLRAFLLGAFPQA